MFIRRRKVSFVVQFLTVVVRIRTLSSRHVGGFPWPCGRFFLATRLTTVSLDYAFKYVSNLLHTQIMKYAWLGYNLHVVEAKVLSLHSKQTDNIYFSIKMLNSL